MNYTIGNFCFRLILPEEITPPEHFEIFRGGTEPEFTYTVRLTDQLPPPEGKVIARRDDLLVTACAGGECRWIGVRGQAAPYACYRELSRQEAEVLLIRERVSHLHIDPVFTSLLALERHLIRRDGLILHCAYMVYEGSAILFSAPSETGKTTQANLWERTRGSRTVNGDRSLLQCVNGVWTARGWPVCGSSEVCHNEDFPIRAIVMLSQEKVDKAEPMTPVQAFSQVLSQITMNKWNRKASVHVMDLTEQLTAAVPVFHLGCTMEETAVEALEKVLPAK